MGVGTPGIDNTDLISLNNTIEAPLDLTSTEFTNDKSFNDTHERDEEEGFEPAIEEYPANVKELDGVQEKIIENQVVTVPCPGMKFGSLNEAKDFYKKYAAGCGFGTMVRSSCTKDISPVEKRKYHTLACDKSGKPRGTSKNSLKPKPTSKTDCKARVNFQEFEDGNVLISSVILDHNHDMSPGKSRYHKSHKQLDPWVKRKLDLNDQAGISLSKNFHSLVIEAGGYENLTFGQRDARNYIQKARILRLGEGDAESLNN